MLYKRSRAFCIASFNYGDIVLLPTVLDTAINEPACNLFLVTVSSISAYTAAVNGYEMVDAVADADSRAGRYRYKTDKLIIAICDIHAKRFVRSCM